MKAITSLDGEIRRYLTSRCLPSLFQTGVYLLPIAFIEEVETTLCTFSQEHEQLVALFVTAYPTLIEIDQTRLRSTFDAKDYPTQESMASLFGTQWQYLE